MSDLNDVVQEFLAESRENLDRLDRDLVALELAPQEAERLASIFRTIHTIKGTCGFLGFGTLESITHLAEDILSQLRDGVRDLTPELVTHLLKLAPDDRATLADIMWESVEGPEGEPEEVRQAWKDEIARIEAAKVASIAAPDACPLNQGQ